MHDFLLVGFYLRSTFQPGAQGGPSRDVRVRSQQYTRAPNTIPEREYHHRVSECPEFLEPRFGSPETKSNLAPVLCDSVAHAQHGQKSKACQWM